MASIGRDGITHRADVLDRGHEHLIRYRATCTCGWIGKYRRRRFDALKLYRDHERARTRRGREATPRRPTPRADLPEILR